MRNKTTQSRSRLSTPATSIGRRQLGHTRWSTLEQLEDRQLLHAGGGISALLTLSYPKDGTDVSGHPSSLHSTFSNLGTDREWQSAIENAFHEWAKHTNADVGVVPDSGVPFGTPEHSDSMFGDVRIAAAPLSENVFAISMPPDNLALGSWASDIIFNSNIDWTSIDQLASVALHEAGHIFGLEHTDDPTSVMHVHGVSDVTAPSTADIANLQFLYGQRNLDRNELNGSNDTLETSTSLSSNLAAEMLGVTYGDISSREDVDVYQISTEDDIEGAIRVVVDNQGLSTADFVVKLYDDDENILSFVESSNESGVIRLDYEFDDDEEDTLYVSVELAAGSLVDSGRYVVAVSLDPGELEDDDDDDEYDDLDEDELRFAEETELGIHLLSNGDFLFGEENNEDDDIETATSIQPRAFNAARVWYEQVGSIDGTDVDFYRLTSPEDDEGLLRVMTVEVQSITSLMLAPTVTVRDALGTVVESQIIRSGNGEHILQVPNVKSESEYFIEVAAEDPTGEAARGNYQLTANFGGESELMTTFSAGSLSNELPVHVRELYVATPQLFHFLLSANPATSDRQPIKMELFDEMGTLVHSLVVEPGQTRSSANPLLQPGAYTLRVGLAAPIADGSELGYSLVGFAVSNPLGVVPVDPTSEPIYECDGLSDQFCYPGGTTSNSPFFWDDFIRKYIESKRKEQQDNGVVTPWFDWFWQDTNSPSGDSPSGDKPASTVRSDSYRVYDQVLIVGEAEGLLKNDTNAGNAPMIVRVASLPWNGTLNLSADGNFRYTPDDGFWGTDEFTYEVFGLDSNRWSHAATVEIHVDEGGDSNGDGQVNFTDFLQFSRAFGTEPSSWATGDFDGNGVTDFSDFLILSGNFGRSVASIMPTNSPST